MDTTNTPTHDTEYIARLNALAVEVDLDTIIVGDRIRRDFSHVPELAESLKLDGLIQPVVLTYDRRLIAGESRIRAAKSIGWKTIRAVFRGVLDEAQLVVLEATENNARQNLTWQERCLSVDKVHRLRSLKATLSGESWGVRETGKLLNQGKSSVSYCTTVAEYLHRNDEEIWKSESLQDAFRVLSLRKAKELEKLIVQQTIPKPTTKFTGPAKPATPLAVPVLTDGDMFAGPGFEVAVGGVQETDEMPGGFAASTATVVPLSQMLYHGDAVSVVKSFPPESFNHVITDWPYGIDMDMLNANNVHGGMNNIEETAKEHDVAENETLHAQIIPELFRVLKPGGYFITWTDLMQWQRNYDLCIAAGFRVQRWALIWHKTSSCMNQSAQVNFTKNYEIAIVARKGNTTLAKTQPSSIWTGGNDAETKLLGHPFAKPFGLWSWLFDAVARKGDTILDPFAGCGSSVIPAIRAGLRPTAVELKEDHYNRMVVNISNLYRSLDPTVTFQ